MYLCLNCNALFERQKQYAEKYSWEDADQIKFGCPSCGGEYVETYECDQCGKYIMDDYIKIIDGSLVCEECYQRKSIAGNICF